MPRRLAGSATVRQIAAESGVSIATVSRVLNGYDGVSPQARTAVHTAVDRLEARAAQAPRRGGAEPAVFVRCPYVLTDYFGLIVSSIAETVELHGRRLILEAGVAAEHRRTLSTLHGQSGIGGAILILPPEAATDLIALRDRGMPFVVIDPRVPMPSDIAAVSAAHFSGARALTAHLVELGHRRVGVIGGPHEWIAGDTRLAGTTAALAAAGVLLPPELVRSVPPTIADGYRIAAELLDLPDRPTAIVGFNDKVALGALRAAAERGLRVPADVSIAGFDDLELSRATSPPLTTVRQPLEEMGRMAVTLLVRLMEQHRLELLQVDLATELIVRESTGPAPAASAAPDIAGGGR
ncbi:LacI family DNA-binding transcriptional regulator [Mangrovihabitans endophyticus]|uniref:Transcriptional regulator n=1 Tax=Mangrovihabitans endophyticus TaxID=1751298 RepID=A0A8J3C6L9_9ACTN|nr:LacI family DNA-binding transcriptional regulator [Mangrovihabitans endophyticus]GGL14362.1 transcriptional regulator [Mangrovihabitans endophyticus]